MPYNGFAWYAYTGVGDMLQVAPPILHHRAELLPERTDSYRQAAVQGAERNPPTTPTPKT